MKIAVISDVTFDLVLKQIGIAPNILIQKYVYIDRIIPELLELNPQQIGIDILIIHIDSYFHRYPDDYISEILNTVKGIAKVFTGSILVSNNLINGRHSSILKSNIGQLDQVIMEVELAVKGILQTNNVYFYDVKNIIARIGLQKAYNFKLGFLYQMPYTKDFINLLATELASFIKFMGEPEKKVIFVDCDNTLWKGILGEDGQEGIQCDRNAGGILFLHFQEFLLEKKKEGFILGICSKNNEQDVKEAFIKLNMPLKWDDFLIKKINWKNKTENLSEVAAELNLGFDSFIFIDDSDFEIQSINGLLPEIQTRKLVNDFDAFLHLCNDYVFKRKRLTKEDLLKSEQYYAEQKRNEVKASFQSFNEYVESLAIKLDISINNVGDFARLSQLTEKTNQFNFNKELISISELEKFVRDKNLVYGLRVSDKFGDYGLVGLILIVVGQKRATLLNFLMSCRALGRRIEDDFLNLVLKNLDERGLYLNEIIFKETPKNSPAKSFFNKLSADRKNMMLNHK